MEFAKLHGLGNDFLVVNVNRADLPPHSIASHARKICHRHCGIGADGVLYYKDAFGDPEADVTVRIFNADGSEAEMSGNGVRCLAAFLFHSGQHRLESPRIRTLSGVKVLTLQGQERMVYTYESSMGAPITDPHKIPVQLDPGFEPIVGYPIAVGSEVVKVTICSMGNPHCSTFWPVLDSAPVHTLGPALEGHDIFANRTNVEFIEVLDRHRLRVRFWERGVGRTLASGTGSCAAAVAAVLHGYVESPVTVETEMGSLLVRWEGSGEVFLTGPAEFVCSGSYRA